MVEKPGSRDAKEVVADADKVENILLLMVNTTNGLLRDRPTTIYCKLLQHVLTFLYRYDRLDSGYAVVRSASRVIMMFLILRAFRFLEVDPASRVPARSRKVIGTGYG
jgi:hypothetical protein